MIELVFVIVVIGIITAVMLPRIDRDNVYEAAQQVISHIKYTQHLAMIDNKFDDTDGNWFQNMWTIQFNDCGGGDLAYTVFSNLDIAKDPLSRKDLDATGCVATDAQDPNVVLSSKYSIDTMVVGGPCAANNYIAFDHLGRGHFNMVTPTNVAQAACTITLTSNTDTAVITVEPETGYTYLSSITP
jgi:type II secretory pathway pseudopilin PulG